MLAERSVNLARWLPMPDPANLLDTGSLVGVLRTIIRKNRDGPDRSKAYEEAGVADFETYLAEAVGNLRVDVARLLAVLEADEERLHVMRNLCFEFRREATTARRRMLAGAGARVGTVELSTAEVARVERALRWLDPEDPPLLKQIVDPDLALEESELFEHDARGCCSRRRFLLERGHLKGANLVAAGCIDRVPHVERFPGVPELSVSGSLSVHEGIEITPIGELVLRYLLPGAVPDEDDHD